jgi:hypothetical protein
MVVMYVRTKKQLVFVWAGHANSGHGGYTCLENNRHGEKNIHRSERVSMPGRSLQAAGVPPSKSGGSMSECTKWSQSIEWIVSYLAVRIRVPIACWYSISYLLDVLAVSYVRSIVPYPPRNVDY